MTQTTDISGQPINASVVTSVVVVNRAVTPRIFQFELDNSGNGDYGNISIYINRTRLSSMQKTAILSGS